MFGLSSELAIVEQSAERLLLQQRPVFWWIVAVVCVLVALNDFRGGNYFFGVVFLGGGLLALFTSPSISVEFDKGSGTMSQKQSILGRGETQSVPLDTIQGVEVEAGMRVGGVTRQSGGTGYRVRLALEGGTYFPLSAEMSASSAPKEEVGKAVAAFLEVPFTSSTKNKEAK